MGQGNRSRVAIALKAQAIFLQNVIKEVIPMPIVLRQLIGLFRTSIKLQPLMGAKLQTCRITRSPFVKVGMS